MLLFLLFTAWIIFNLIYWFALDAVPRDKEPREWFHPSIKRKDNPKEFWQAVIFALFALLLMLTLIAVTIIRHGFHLPY